MATLTRSLSLIALADFASPTMMRPGADAPLTGMAQAYQQAFSDC